MNSSIEFNKMTDNEALSWLMQPGIQATLFNHDKNTNGALIRAIDTLKEKIEKIQSSTSKNTKIVYGREDTYFYTYTQKGTKISSGCYDWCCMNAEIQNYIEQDNLSEDDAYKRFWEDVRNDNEKEFDKTVARYGDLKTAIEEGALDEIRLDYVNTIYDFEESSTIIEADEWKYKDWDIEYNDNDEEIFSFWFSSKREEDSDLCIQYDPDIALSKGSYEKGIIAVEIDDHWFTKYDCTENDKEEIYKLLDIAKEKSKEEIDKELAWLKREEG